MYKATLLVVNVLEHFIRHLLLWAPTDGHVGRSGTKCRRGQRNESPNPTNGDDETAAQEPGVARNTSPETEEKKKPRSLRAAMALSLEGETLQPSSLLANCASLHHGHAAGRYLELSITFLLASPLVVHVRHASRRLRVWWTPKLPTWTGHRCGGLSSNRGTRVIG